MCAATPRRLNDHRDAAGTVPGWIGAVPAVLWLTTFALIVGHTEQFDRPEGALQLGNLALHLFFVVIGIWSRVEEILSVGAAGGWVWGSDRDRLRPSPTTSHRPGCVRRD